MAKQDWVSITEAAEIANVHRQTIWRGCDGKDKVFKTAIQIGTTWMIDRDEVIRYGEYYHSIAFNESEEVE